MTQAGSTRSTRSARMRPSKLSKLAAMLLAVTMLTTLNGCALTSRVLGGIGGIFGRNHNNDYAEANKKLQRESELYTAARHIVVDPNEQVIVTPNGTVTVPPNTRRVGAVTDPQWREFDTLEQNVAEANRFVDADMMLWSATGTKPPSFDGNAKALLAAQNKLIAFTRTVKP